MWYMYPLQSCAVHIYVGAGCTYSSFQEIMSVTNILNLETKYTYLQELYIWHQTMLLQTRVLNNQSCYKTYVTNLLGLPLRYFLFGDSCRTRATSTVPCKRRRSAVLGRNVHLSFPGETGIVSCFNECVGAGHEGDNGLVDYDQVIKLQPFTHKFCKL